MHDTQRFLTRAVAQRKKKKRQVRTMVVTLFYLFFFLCTGKLTTCLSPQSLLNLILRMHITVLNGANVHISRTRMPSRSSRGGGE